MMYMRAVCGSRTTKSNSSGRSMSATWYRTPADDEDPGSSGQVDDVQFHGAAGAEPSGADNVDLVGRRLTGHAEVTLAVATTRDTRLPLVEQLRRGFAGPDPWGPGVVRLAGLLG